MIKLNLCIYNYNDIYIYLEYQLFIYLFFQNIGFKITIYRSSKIFLNIYLNIRKIDI